MQDSEEYSYTMRTLKRMGYANQIKHSPYPGAVNQLGITIFVSDVFKVIGGYWRYGFAPYEYNCKASRVVKEIQNHTNGTNEVSFNKFTNPINEIKDTVTWKDLNKFLVTETEHRVKNRP